MTAASTAVDFELAYQVRIVMDRIRFALRVTDQASPTSIQLLEAGIQLLDAFDRLDRIDLTFQRELKLQVPCLNRSVPIAGESM
jgi:hypothetical protein